MRKIVKISMTSCLPTSFVTVLMQNEPKVETSSDVPLKTSANFVDLRKRSYGL